MWIQGGEDSTVIYFRVWNNLEMQVNLTHEYETVIIEGKKGML